MKSFSTLTGISFKEWGITIENGDTGSGFDVNSDFPIKFAELTHELLEQSFGKDFKNENICSIGDCGKWKSID